MNNVFFSNLLSLFNALDKGEIDNLSQFKNRKKSKSSVYQKAKESIAFFPVLFSSSISSEIINPVLKALERQFAVYIKIAIQQEDIIDITNPENKREFLRSLGFGEDNRLMKLLNETSLNKNESLFKNTILTEWVKIINLKKHYRDEISNVTCLNEFFMDKNLVKEVILEKANHSDKEVKEAYNRLKDFVFSDEFIDYAESKGFDNDAIDAYREGFKKTKYTDIAPDDIFQESEEVDKYRFNNQNYGKKNKSANSNNANNSSSNVNNKSINNHFKNNNNDDSDEGSGKDEKSESIVTKISDIELKKYSELPPTVLEVTVHYKSGNTIINTQLVLGVKAVAHFVNYDDMVHHISKGIKENNNFLRFIKWTSGEISFWKDFVFSIPSIKEDIIDANKKQYGDIWFRLKYLKYKDILMRFFSKGHTPTAVLVLSVSDVEDIKKKSNYDLWNWNSIKKLFDSFFILSFIIVDEASRMVYINNGDEANFQKVDYKYLANEKNDDSAVKALLGFVTR